MTKDPLTWLYPPIEPFRIHRLRVSGLHELHVEESGNPAGKPVVFLHGGPGGGTGPKHRRFFDPRKYRIILFDQRGCGQSTPYAEVRENTTWDLVEDIERVRKHLGVDRWQVFGGSWGSTLALAYAQKHPDRVSELVLRGIFLLREWELRWFYQEGASRMFPEQFAAFRAAIPESEHGDLAAAYAKRLFSDDPSVNLPAAKAWSVWEGSVSKLLPDEAFAATYGQEATTLAFARIECHYFVHKGWLESEDQLLRDAGKLKGIPGAIVQGRYDCVCPPQNAWDLHLAWPDSELVMVPDAGHSATEWNISKALVAATDRYAG
ncbi:MAG TPA: prolyl aminopeptidase [Holophagaceae bacterium]|jgi:proline iminopeptidase|nr:prolyl aminopeptidase [Holophagaceae bacterium]